MNSYRNEYFMIIDPAGTSAFIHYTKLNGDYRTIRVRKYEDRKSLNKLLSLYLKNEIPEELKNK